MVGGLGLVIVCMGEGFVKCVWVRVVKVCVGEGC